MTATLRATVGLSADDVAFLDHIKDASSPEAVALDSLTGITLDQKASAAQTVYAILVVGLRAIEKEAEEIGYARQAAFEQDHPDCLAWRTLLSTRSMPSFMSHEGSNSAAGAA